MIVIATRRDVDLDTYDEVWYPTTTCPGMQIGCKHKPELGPSKYTSKYYYETKDLDGFMKRYAQELECNTKLLQDVVKYCEDKWVEMVCYEEDPRESDIYLLYQALAKLTSNIRILERK